MDPRLYPFWEAQPLEELEPGLRKRSSASGANPFQALPWSSPSSAPA